MAGASPDPLSKVGAPIANRPRAAAEDGRQVSAPRRNGCGRTRRRSTAATCRGPVDRQTAEFSKTTRTWARPRSLANRLAKHKSVVSPGRRQEVRAEPQKLRNPLERPSGVEHDGPRLPARQAAPRGRRGQTRSPPRPRGRRIRARRPRISSRSSSGRWQYPLNEPSKSGGSRPGALGDVDRLVDRGIGLGQAVGDLAVRAAAPSARWRRRTPGRRAGRPARPPRARPRGRPAWAGGRSARAGARRRPTRPAGRARARRRSPSRWSALAPRRRPRAARRCRSTRSR